jgi:hypothetical protein
MSLNLVAAIAVAGVVGTVALVGLVRERQPQPLPGAAPESRQQPAGQTPAPPPVSPPARGPNAPRAAPVTPRQEAADSAAIDQFQKELQAYLEIHDKVEKALPKLPSEASIQQIDSHQRALLQGIAAARPNARRGQLFSPAMEAAVRRVIAKVFEGVEGRQLRESIMEENPTNVTISVNGRYPDTVPLATMPPDILAELPKMPEELQYRFVGRALAIMDVHAHLIVDFVPDALPR